MLAFVTPDVAEKLKSSCWTYKKPYIYVINLFIFRLNNTNTQYALINLRTAIVPVSLRLWCLVINSVAMSIASQHILYFLACILLSINSVTLYYHFHTLILVIRNRAWISRSTKVQCVVWFRFSTNSTNRTTASVAREQIKDNSLKKIIIQVITNDNQAIIHNKFN